MSDHQQGPGPGPLPPPPPAMAAQGGAWPAVPRVMPLPGMVPPPPAPPGWPGYGAYPPPPAPPGMGGPMGGPMMGAAPPAPRSPYAPGVIITSPFGTRVDPQTGEQRFHHGIDIGMPVGTPVLAVIPGRVEVWEHPDAGNAVTLTGQAGPYAVEIRYLHLSRPLVPSGAHVAAGQAIAESGNTGRSTGPHLHLEIKVNGQLVDPAQILDIRDMPRRG